MNQDSDQIPAGLDSNGNSQLLGDNEGVQNEADLARYKTVPSTTVIHSLFSENHLLLDQD